MVSTLPIYSTAGRSSHEAQDLTQAFFAWLLASEHLPGAQPERGRFRSYLLTMLQHFLSDEHKKAHAEKRGGRREFVSLDAQSSEDHYRVEPITWTSLLTTNTPDTLKLSLPASASEGRGFYRLLSQQ